MPYRIEDFDWEYYLSLYEDLRKHGIRTKCQAFKHYLHHGIRENRVCKRPSKKDIEEEYHAEQNIDYNRNSASKKVRTRKGCF